MDAIGSALVETALQRVTVDRISALDSPPTGRSDPISWPQKKFLFGVGINTEDYAETVEKVFEAADQHVPAIVEHLAVNNLVLATRSASFLQIINRFDLVTMDGQGVRFGMRTLNGVRSRDRVTARELMLAICQRAEISGHGIYLYGDQRGTLRRLEARLRARFPKMNIVGSEPSMFRALSHFEDVALADRVNNSGAAFLFVALGCPLQERFAYEHKGKIRAIQLCVGSAFKFLAGERSIAPRWIQKIGLEWLYRLAQDPRRLAMRYLGTNTLFVCMLFGALFDQLICGSKRARWLKRSDP
jgi:N-acetylglucosaminyldiphosphoundecaprenol N-acetyl-beta-D-mannosaminyltransferase